LDVDRIAHVATHTKIDHDAVDTVGGQGKTAKS
jgi:hypothetical protein